MFAGSNGEMKQVDHLCQLNEAFCWRREDAQLVLCLPYGPECGKYLYLYIQFLATCAKPSKVATLSAPAKAMTSACSCT